MTDTDYQSNYQCITNYYTQQTRKLTFIKLNFIGCEAPKVHIQLYRQSWFQYCYTTCVPASYVVFRLFSKLLSPFWLMDHNNIITCCSLTAIVGYYVGGGIDVRIYKLLKN